MENPERYLRFVREAERLKDTLRSAHTSQGRHESTAEDVYKRQEYPAVPFRQAQIVFFT